MDPDFPSQFTPFRRRDPDPGLVPFGCLELMAAIVAFWMAAWLMGDWLFRLAFGR